MHDASLSFHTNHLRWTAGKMVWPQLAPTCPLKPCRQHALLILLNRRMLRCTRVETWNPGLPTAEISLDLIDHPVRLVSTVLSGCPNHQGWFDQTTFLCSNKTATDYLEKNIFRFAVHLFFFLFFSSHPPPKKVNTTTSKPKIQSFFLEAPITSRQHRPSEGGCCQISQKARGGRCCENRLCGYGLVVIAYFFVMNLRVVVWCQSNVTLFFCSGWTCRLKWHQ